MGSGVSASYSGARPQPVQVSRFQAKHLLFGAIALMYLYVLWTNERFLFDSKDPEWKHIDGFKWWLTQLHRQWMTRSFACALIFIEVRVVQGLTGWQVFTGAIVWTCVAAAFPLADLVLHWQDMRKRNP